MDKKNTLESENEGCIHSYAIDKWAVLDTHCLMPSSFGVEILKMEAIPVPPKHAVLQNQGRLTNQQPFSSNPSAATCWETTLRQLTQFLLVVLLPLSKHHLSFSLIGFEGMVQIKTNLVVKWEYKCKLAITAIWNLVSIIFAQIKHFRPTF